MRWISTIFLIALSTCGVADAASARRNEAHAPGGVQSAGPAPSQGGSVLVIHLEQRKNDKAIAMYPGHVFDAGDVVRFRVSTKGMEGYLYVVDQGSSGSYTTLFPAEGSSADTSLLPEKDVFVPAIEDGWFEVGGPAGFDVLYFVVSREPLHIPAKAGESGKSGPEAPVPDSLKPRCDDEVFRARGECVDISAGPAALSRDVPLPPQISAAAKSASRDIVFEEDDEDHSVKATAPPDKPAVYVFRLAHR